MQEGVLSEDIHLENCWKAVISLRSCWYGGSSRFISDCFSVLQERFCFEGPKNPNSNPDHQKGCRSRQPFFFYSLLFFRKDLYRDAQRLLITGISGEDDIRCLREF